MDIHKSANKRPCDKGMRKGLLYANANMRSRQYKRTVVNYLREHFDIENISALQKQVVAEKFELSISTISAYIEEMIEQAASVRKMTTDVPMDPRLLNGVIQSEPALTFNQALNLKLPLNEYSTESIPDGWFAARLDFKVFGKLPNTINLFLVHCKTGQKIRLTQFAYNGEYKPKDGHIDLAEGYLNGRMLELNVYHNAKGYAVISEVNFI